MAYGKLKVDTITYDDSGTDVDVSVSALAGAGSAAPLASPAFTGTPSAPTAAVGTNTTQLATTAFVTAATPDISGKADTADIGVTIQAYDSATVKKDEVNTFTQGQTFNGGIFVDGFYRTTAEPLPSANIALNTGTFFKAQVSSNVTWTFSSAPNAGQVGSFTVEITHFGGTITWPSTVKWPGGTAPTLTAGKTHLFAFVTTDNGQNYHGAALVDY